MAAAQLNALIDSFESGPGGILFGRTVSERARASRYPLAWWPLVERYIHLVGEDAAEANVRLYCDLVCTVVTKKIMMCDAFYLYDEEHWEDDADDEVPAKRLREAHAEAASKYLECMLACVAECLEGRVPDRPELSRAATVLYARVYAEAFDPDSVQENEVFRVVRGWFRDHVSPRAGVGPPPLAHDVAPDTPFLACSHVYWLWLHLTAARVRRAERELLTVVYGLDTIVYCSDCRAHFVEHRSALFDDTWDGETGNCFAGVGAAELLFRLHNRINAQTGVPETDRAVLAEYEAFWSD